MDDLWFPVCRPMNFLFDGGSSLLDRKFWKMNGSLGASRFINRFDNPHVSQSFQARGLGFLVFEHAVREIDQLSCKLISFREGFRCLFFADG